MLVMRVILRFGLLFCLQQRDQLNLRASLPTFTFLGNLLEAVPDVAHCLVTEYGETLTRC